MFLAFSPKPGVGNLFCTADRFETEFFRGPTFKNPQFSNEYLLQLM